MKIINKWWIVGLFLSLTSQIVVATNYSGVWQDINGLHYSIHQSADVILVTKLEKVKATLQPYQQGNIIFTEEALDLAINGVGFFILELDDGSHAYTRDGHFLINQNGQIVNEKGDKLVTENRLPIPFFEDSNPPDPFLLNQSFKCTSINIETNTPEVDEACMSLNNTHTNELVISHMGLMSINGPENNFDQIILASIHPKNLLSLDEYLIVKDLDSVSYHIPGEESIGLVQQGALEALEYEIHRWQVYSGILDDGVAVLNELPTEINPKYKQSNINYDSPIKTSIIFTDENNAVIENKCTERVLSPFLFCDSKSRNEIYPQQIKLNKVF